MEKNRKQGVFSTDTLQKGLLMFKWSLFFFCLGIIQVFAVDSYSQQIRFSLDYEKVQIVSVLNEIENQSDYYFLYNEDLVNVNQIVAVQVKDEKIDKVLNQLFESRGIEYSIHERQIVLTSSNTTHQNSINQGEKSIKGTVKSTLGEPIPGATVIIKGTTEGTITNLEGNYLISNVPTNGILVFSFVGMKTQEVAVVGKSIINIEMVEETIGLEEVVAIGYGTKKRGELTESVASVGREDLQNITTSNALQAVQAKVAGVNITQDDWNPGAQTSIRVRGNRSITASNDPLYVIDGTPISRGSISINDINPADIEFIDILKDAAATAIYGSRGANGVILITTKRGKAGKTVVSYDGYQGIQTPLNDLKVYDGGEYAEYVREAYRNNNRYNSAVPTKEEDMKLVQFSQDPYVMESVLMGYDSNGNYDPSKVRSFNWLDQVTQVGRVESHQLSINGGNEKTRMLLSAGYYRNKGMVKNKDFKRYNIRINMDHNVNCWLKVGASMLVSRAHKQEGSNLYHFARFMNPLASPYDADGNLTLNPGNDPMLINPIMDIDGIEDDSRKDRILTNFNIDLNLAQGLTFRSTLGYDYRTARDGRFEKSSSTYRSGKSDYAKYGGNSTTDLLLDNMLNYEKTLNDVHDFKVTLVQSAQTNRFETFNSEVEGLPYQSQQYYNIGTAQTIKKYETGLVKWQMLSFMGRFDYAYKGKYLLTLVGRQDGSSVLAEGNKTKFFPSAAAAWRISDESFLAGSNTLDDLKLRISYGKTGNSAISPYKTQGNLLLTRYVWDENVTIGFVPFTMPNMELSWETTTLANIGIDFGLFNNRLSGTIEVYQSNTNDLLMPRKIPVVTGFEDVLSNVGKTRNTGIDINLNGVIANRNGFKWKTDLVFSSNKEEIVELINGKEDITGSGWFIGQPISVYFDQEAAGIWQDTPGDLAEMEKFNANGHNYKPGYVKIRDVNGDYKINSEDRLILGSNRPKWIAGLTNNFNYKQFDFSFQLYASYGALGRYDKQLQLNGRQNMVAVDYWTPDNPSNKYPLPSAGWLYPDNIDETYYEDASYVRVKYITLGYSLPESVNRKLGIGKLRVYLTAQNPMLFTKFEGLDPEGAQGFNTPSPKTIMTGINFNF